MKIDDAQAKRRPSGRTLAEFIKDGPLSKAERLVLEAVATGNQAEIGADWPRDDKRLRPGFVRFLALGGDDATPVHEHGIRITHGWIDGDLDLENSRVSVELTLLSCEITGMLILRDAELFGVNLCGSSVYAVSAERVRTQIVVLEDGFHANGLVNLAGARVAGDVRCRGGKFEGGSAGAL